MMVLRLAAFTATCLTLTGCLSLKPKDDPARYFVLSPALAESGDAQARPFGAAFGIAPVEVSPHLRKGTLAIRKSDNEIRYSDFLTWSEDLSNGVRTVLAVNLSSLLGTQRLFISSWHEGEVDYVLHTTILRFESEERGRVHIDARWRISKPEDRDAPYRGAFQAERDGPPPLEDPAGSVAVMSDLLAEMSRKIAESLRSMDQSGTPAPSVRQP